MDVDTIKRLLLAQQKQRVQRWEAVSRKRHFSPPFFFSVAGLGIAPPIAVQWQSGPGLGYPAATLLCGVRGKRVAFGCFEGRGAPKLAGRKATVRWLCGLFKQLGDPPSNRRKSCHRHPQQAIKSDFPFQGHLVPLLGFSPLCKHTHTHTSGREG